MKPIRASTVVTTEMASDLHSAAGLLTRAERAHRKLPHVVSLALAFYLAETKKCVACVSGTRCDIHGTDAVRPPVAKDDDADSPSSEDTRLVIATYSAQFTEARGLRPSIGAREGKAANELVRAVGAQSACEAIRSAYADPFWKGKATLLSIAADPSRHLGTVAATPKATSLQPDSGYESNGKEVR